MSWSCSQCKQLRINKPRSNFSCHCVKTATYNIKIQTWRETKRNHFSFRSPSKTALLGNDTNCSLGLVSKTNKGSARFQIASTSHLISTHLPPAPTCLTPLFAFSTSSLLPRARGLLGTFCLKCMCGRDGFNQLSSGFKSRHTFFLLARCFASRKRRV